MPALYGVSVRVAPPQRFVLSRLLVALFLVAGLPECSSGEPFAGAPVRRIPLRDWQLQASSHVQAGGAAISGVGFAADGWYPIRVPSTVLAGLTANGEYRRLFYGSNLTDVPKGDFEVPWWYRTEFALSTEEARAFPWIHFDGVNYRADVWVNGRRITTSQRVVGTYRTFAFDVSKILHAGRNAVAVEVFPVDPDRDLTITWIDWNPMAPDHGMGLWRDVYLTTSGPVALEDPQVTSQLTLPDLGTADLTVTVCHDCRTALAGAHPDVTVVATEHVHLRVEDVRPLVTLAQQRPALGRWRVIVIEDADRLGDISGNVLLKAIEEPPARTVWLLCAPSPDDVLVTIRSRCRQVGLRIPPVADVAALLVRRHGVDPAVAAYAARAADSHVGLARRLATDEEARIRRREILRLPMQLSSVGAAVMAAGQLVEVATEEAKSATAQRATAERAQLLRALGAEGMSTLPPPVRAQVRVLEENQKRRATRAQRDVLDRALVDLTSFYRDVLMLQLGAPVELTNADLLADLEKLAVASPPEATLVRMEAIGLARERIGANVAPLLAVEALMVTLLVGAVPAPGRANRA